MGEVRRKVETYSVDMICPKCGVGIMRPFGDIALTTCPPQFPHECQNCKNIETFFECYPRIEYKVIEDE